MTDIRSTINIIKSRNDAIKIISTITTQLDDYSSDLRKKMRLITKQRKMPHLVIFKQQNCLFCWRIKGLDNVYRYQREYIIGTLENIYKQYAFLFDPYEISIIW